MPKRTMPSAHLVAFEGLDQSGKETQARLLRDAIRARGQQAEYVTFPDYTTPIGHEIGRALRSQRSFEPDVLQLLFVANRYEWKPRIAEMLVAGTHVICDRYLASSVAYGEAQGVDPEWMFDVQRLLPQPAITIVLDIEPQVAVRRKATNRDAFERDLGLLGRVRQSYLRQAKQPGWVVINGARPKRDVADDVLGALSLLHLV